MGICMASEADSPEDLYTKADRALYRSKVGGRNRVTKHSDDGRPRRQELAALQEGLTSLAVVAGFEPSISDKKRRLSPALFQ